jgi:gamma-glutamyl hercynylcysteine S-oxide synthase
MASLGTTGRTRLLTARLAEAREETDELFRIVRTEALYDRPLPERHRIVFYIGHLEAFDWNLLRETFGLPAFHPELDRLFAFGIDPVEGGLPSDQPRDWPQLGQVYDYRDRVRQLLEAPLKALNEGDARLGQLLNVAIEHRLMHAETLAYMFHQLPFERKAALTAQRVLHGQPVTSEAVPVPEGRATLGLRRASGAFGWDNEFEEHVVTVPAFTIDRHKVTNGEYLRFMNEGGYADAALWTDAAWAWQSARGIEHPVFWARRGVQWIWRSMFDEVPLPLTWPVYVSHAEASAYARWAGKMLPTEPQWHRAAYGGNAGEREYPWGDEQPPALSKHPASGMWDPSPVNARGSGASAFGVEGLLGNGWEWTSTEFGPFAGFERFPFYPGYSANFFDGKHYVMKGGSVRTDPCMLRRSFRNWFQPHYQYVYAGFRCAGGQDARY